MPSNYSLQVEAGKTIRLNNNSIISTGGTINYTPGVATINGLRATLYSSIVLKGLCGSIQTAAIYAPSGQSQVLLENGNFNENVTFLNKTGLQITGNSTNYTQFGTLTLTNCDYFYGGVFGAKRININQTSTAFLSDVYGYGINKTDYGLYLYYCDNIQVDEFNAGLYDACVMASTAEADISQSLLGSSNNGIMVYNASDIYADHSYFCGTNVDLYAYNFSSILTDYCSFDGSPNISQGGGSTITTMIQSKLWFIISI